MALPQERRAIFWVQPSRHLHPALEDTLDGTVPEPTRLCLHPALLPQEDYYEDVVENHPELLTPVLTPLTDNVAHRRFGSPEPPVFIHPLEGVVIDEDVTDSLSLHSHFLPEEEEQEEDDVIEIHLCPSSFPVLWTSHSETSGDRTRPSFLMRIENSDERSRSRSSVPPPHLRIPRRDSAELFITTPPSTPYDQIDSSSSSVEEEAKKYPQYERKWRLYEKKEMTARDARVAVSEQCHSPVPNHITQCSGPMRVINIDRRAASTSLQAEGEEEDPKGNESTYYEEEEDTVQPLSEYADVAGWVGVEEMCESPDEEQAIHDEDPWHRASIGETK